MNTSQKSFIPKFLNRSNQSYKLTIIAAAAVLTVLLAAVSICIGAVQVTASELFSVLFLKDTGSKAYQIITLVRLPRTLAAILAGAALAVAGSILQTVLNNSLASPNIIGVNAGSGLFTIIISAMFPQLFSFIPFAAFLGALFSVLLVYFIAKKTGASKMTIVLSGVAVSSFLSAITDTILTIVPDAQFNRMSFLIGSFSGVTMDHIKLAGVCIIIAILFACILSYDMNILALGDQTSKSLGLNTAVLRMIFLVIAALLAGSAISFCGLVGFIGLIVPHTVRMLIGTDNRYTMPFTAILGAAFALLCDMLARVLFAPYEIPVGIVMSFLGGPFFIYLLLRRKRRERFD